MAAPENSVAVPWTGSGRPSRRQAAATASGSRTSVAMVTMWDTGQLHRQSLRDGVGEGGRGGFVRGLFPLT